MAPTIFKLKPAAAYVKSYIYIYYFFEKKKSPSVSKRRNKERKNERKKERKKETFESLMMKYGGTLNPIKWLS